MMENPNCIIAFYLPLNEANKLRQHCPEGALEWATLFDENLNMDLARLKTASELMAYAFDRAFKRRTNEGI